MKPFGSDSQGDSEMFEKNNEIPKQKICHQSRDVVFYVKKEKNVISGSERSLKDIVCKGADISLGLHTRIAPLEYDEYEEIIPFDSIVVEGDTVSGFTSHHINPGTLEKWVRREKCHTFLCFSSNRTYSAIRLPLRNGVKTKDIPNAILNNDVYEYWRWYGDDCWSKVCDSDSITDEKIKKLSSYTKENGCELKLAVHYAGLIHFVLPVMYYFHSENNEKMSIMTNTSLIRDGKNNELFLVDFLVNLDGRVSVRKERYNYYCNTVGFPGRVRRFVRRKISTFLPIKNLSFEDTMCTVEVFMKKGELSG